MVISVEIRDTNKDEVCRLPKDDEIDHKEVQTKDLLDSVIMDPTNKFYV